MFVAHNVFYDIWSLKDNRNVIINWFTYRPLTAHFCFIAPIAHFCFTPLDFFTAPSGAVPPTWEPIIKCYFNKPTTANEHKKIKTFLTNRMQSVDIVRQMTSFSTGITSITRTIFFVCRTGISRTSAPSSILLQCKIGI